MILAVDRDQAGIVFGYVAGLIDETPMIAARVESQSAEAIHFAGRVSIVVQTSSFRAIRGRTVVAAILDEIAFWRSDESANPDREILRALRPATATVPGSMIVGISSPYARRGVLWEAFKKHFGRNDSAVLVWRATTREMNPLIEQETIDADMAEDEAAAQAECLAEFRRDIDSYISPDVVEASVVDGRFELPPLSDTRYLAFVDPSGGTSDSMTMAIGHYEARATPE
jgi:hypothetical protein